MAARLSHRCLQLATQLTDPLLCIRARVTPLSVLRRLGKLHPARPLEVVETQAPRVA